MGEPIRLQKYFTDCGVMSRRAAEAEIAAGRVLVNGSVASVGDKIDPDADTVMYQNKIIKPTTDEKRRTVMLNKPRGFVTTAKDEKGRHTVLELVRGCNTRLYPIGRLDMDSEGLLLLTNDGELANHLTHPRHEIPKLYHVTLASPPTEHQLAQLAQPMELDGYRLLPMGVERLSDDILQMTLYEGRNRQIRRTCEAVGLQVKRLRRVAIGNLVLDLPIGKWRDLTDGEIAYLTKGTTPKNERN